MPRKLSWKTCPACKSRIRKIINEATGLAECTQCGHAYPLPASAPPNFLTIEAEEMCRRQEPLYARDRYKLDVFPVTPERHPVTVSGWSFNAFRVGDLFAFRAADYNHLYPSKLEAERAGEAAIDRDRGIT